MIFVILLACQPAAPVREGIRSLQLLAPTAPTGATADTGTSPDPLPTIVAVGIGQSNDCLLIPKTVGWPYDLNGNHAGVTLIRNGVQKSFYTGPVGSDAYLIDELLAVGYAPEQIVLVQRCAQNVPIANLITVQMPAIEADLQTFGLHSPDFLMVWQGERESLEDFADKTKDGALMYYNDLIGPLNTYSLRKAVEEAGWVGVRWSIVELAVRSTEYVDAQSAALVRSAQLAAAAYYGPNDPERICTIPTFGSTFMPGAVTPNDNPHVDITSMEAISRRVVHGWVDEECP